MKPAATMRLDWLDAFRGLAALWVVLFHVRVDLWVGWNEIRAHPAAYSMPERIVAWLSVPTTFGGSGVMLFFLISGFCVHLPQAGKTAPLDLRVYGVRRFFRIYPPYLAAVIFTMLCAAIGTRLGATGEVSTTVWWQTLLMVQNYGAGQPGPNPAFWSLPVEMELYLAYCVMLPLMRRCGWTFGLAIVGGLSAALNAGLIASGHPEFHGNFLQFWLIWAAGALLAEWWATNRVPAFGVSGGLAALGLLVAAVKARFSTWPIAVSDHLWAGFYFLLLWFALAQAGWFERCPVVLRRGLTLLGTCSYSVYLIHFPVFFVWGAAWRQAFDGSKPTSFLIPLAAAFLIVPTAWLFWKWTEDPSQRFARTLARHLQGKPASAR